MRPTLYQQLRIWIRIPMELGMGFFRTLAGGLVFVVVLAGCGSSTGVSLVTDRKLLPVSGLSDECDDAGSLSSWLVRSEVEGDPSDGSVSIRDGQLLLRPVQDHYFLNDQRGLSLFKNLEVGADPRFMIETHVAAVDRASGGAPTETFHSAGLVVYPDVTRMSDWVVVNIGLQSGTLAFEDKSTVGGTSVLTLYDTGQELSGAVRLCVVGNLITVFTRLDSEATWTERNAFTHAVGPIVGAGVMVNDFQAGTAEVEGQFEYVRFEEIDSLVECRV